MRARWRVRAAAGVVVALAGCGGGTPVVTTQQAVPPSIAAIGSARPESVYSADYCQQLEHGSWVTNDSPTSTTSCVPDPSYATGDETADSASVVPRCFSCTLAQWKQAERRRRSVRAGSATSTTPDSTALARSELATKCAVTGEETERQCGCVANNLATVVPFDEIQNLPADDPRVGSALRSCLPAGSR